MNLDVLIYAVAKDHLLNDVDFKFFIDGSFAGFKSKDIKHQIGCIYFLKDSKFLERIGINQDELYFNDYSFLERYFNKSHPDYESIVDAIEVGLMDIAME